MTANDANASESENAGSPGTATAENLEPIEQSPDEIFTVLASRRRRVAVRYLANEVADDETITRGELATQITARITDTQPRNIDTGTRKSVYVGLYQTHLEKLADTNIIEQVPDGLRKSDAVETAAAIVEHVDAVCTIDDKPEDGDLA